MGACGCGEGYDFRLKAPRGWYLINVYPGCDYCDTPAGVHIDFETRADFSSALPDYPIDKDGLGAGLAIVSADSVKSALLAELTGAVVDGETVDDLCEFDDLHKRVFAHAVRGALEAAELRSEGWENTHNQVKAQWLEAVERAEKAERERDEARAQVHLGKLAREALGK